MDLVIFLAVLHASTLRPDSRPAIQFVDWIAWKAGKRSKKGNFGHFGARLEAVRGLGLVLAGLDHFAVTVIGNFCSDTRQDCDSVVQCSERYCQQDIVDHGHHSCL